MIIFEVALRKESVDRNLSFPNCIRRLLMSLSARRVWIEIPIVPVELTTLVKSLSARRVWIEITYVTRLPCVQVSSLSARRVWIEIKTRSSVP